MIEQLNAYQLAKKLKVSHTTIYTWIVKGLPYETIKVGNRISMRFTVEDTKEWLKNR